VARGLAQGRIPPGHAAFDGAVVRASDGVAGRAWLHPVREIGLVLKNVVTFRASKVDALLRNTSSCGPAKAVGIPCAFRSTSHDDLHPHTLSP
jgi:hypothetical protein